MLTIGAIVWGVTDLDRSIRFWTAALDYEVRWKDSDFAALGPKDGKEGVQLSLSIVTSPHARRHHMDLFCEDRECEAERLISLGARRKEWRYPPDADYIVLLDPDGNPFCVCS
ncbi:MAG: VOC family protein [Clostridia bacterium]|nr:VOC family protein [Clostridia bacterium]